MTQKHYTSFGMKNTLYCKEKKTNPPHWFITLLRHRDDSLLNYILCLQLKVTIATELGGQRRQQAFAQGCRIHAVILGCTTAGAKGRECCPATSLKMSNSYAQQNLPRWQFIIYVSADSSP